METEKVVHYFAYGSNLHPMRILERVPSAKLIGTAELEKHCLAFHKKSKDGSGKCNVLNTGRPLDLVHGAIYCLDFEQKRRLDKFEGKGFGYNDTEITLRHQGQEYICFTYLAEQSYIADNLHPYDWYKEMVVLGSKYLCFPDSYISSIESIRSIEDPDTKRKSENENLLDKIRNYKLNTEHG